MSSKNVAIRKDVYDALRRERRPQESFTKLLQRLLNRRGPLSDLSGSWSGESGQAATQRWVRLRHRAGGSRR